MIHVKQEVNLQKVRTTAKTAEVRASLKKRVARIELVNRKVMKVISHLFDVQSGGSIIKK